MKSRQEIKALAKEAMRAQRGTAILLGFLYLVVTGVSVAIDEITLHFAGLVAYNLVFWAGMLVLYVMIVNMVGEYLKVYRGEQASVGALFSGFKINFGRKLGGMLWMTLWLTLWSLLALPAIIAGVVLVLPWPVFGIHGANLMALGVLLLMASPFLMIPAIIKGLSYYMTTYILASRPNVTALAALKLSMRMTDGHKGKLFVLYLSFIGWGLLSVLTLGILYIVYVGPYMYTTFAGFVTEMEEQALADGTVSPEELGMGENRDRGLGIGIE